MRYDFKNPLNVLELNVLLISQDIEPEPEVLQIEDYKTGVAEKPFGSRVTILKATPEIVGRYYCLYESAEDTVDDLAELPPLYKADSTYIFVKDQQMVPVLNPVVHGVQYADVIIPCKPSSKDGMVELVKDEHEVTSGANPNQPRTLSRFSPPNAT